MLASVLGACAQQAPPDPATCPRRTLVLEFDGGTYYGDGFDHDDASTNVSSTLYESGTLSAYHASDPDRATRIAMIVDQVCAALAPFPINVLTEKPAPGPYLAVAVGGYPSELGYDSTMIGLGGDNHCETGAPHGLAIVFGDQIESRFGDVPEMVGNMIIGEYGGLKAVPGSSSTTDCMSTRGWDPGVTCTIGGVDTARDPATACGSGATFHEHEAFALAPCD